MKPDNRRPDPPDCWACSDSATEVRYHRPYPGALAVRLVVEECRVCQGGRIVPADRHRGRSTLTLRRAA